MGTLALGSQKRREWEEAKAKAEHATADAEAAQKRAEEFARELLSEKLKGFQDIADRILAESKTRSEQQKTEEQLQAKEMLRYQIRQSFASKSYAFYHDTGSQIHGLISSGVKELDSNGELMKLAEEIRENHGRHLPFGQAKWLWSTPKALKILKGINFAPWVLENAPTQDLIEAFEKRLEELRKEHAPETLDDDPAVGG